MCLLILHMCPSHTNICVFWCYICVLLIRCLLVLGIYVSSYYCICVLILLHMCPHTTVCVSDTILLIRCLLALGICMCYMCPHTIPPRSWDIYVFSYYGISVLYYYICVCILLYMCPHTTIYVSSPTTYVPPILRCVLILLYVRIYYICVRKLRILLCIRVRIPSLLALGVGFREFRLPHFISRLSAKKSSVKW